MRPAQLLRNLGHGYRYHQFHRFPTSIAASGLRVSFSSTGSSRAPRSSLQVIQFPAHNASPHQILEEGRNGLDSASPPSSQGPLVEDARVFQLAAQTKTWQEVNLQEYQNQPSIETASSSPSIHSLHIHQHIYQLCIMPFLPAHHPRSVASGYNQFAIAHLVANIAGSTAMVLATQRLLVAVLHPTASGVAAGALNWIVKDGVGQFGGVLFASRLGKGQLFDVDAHPKQWRWLAAMVLDAASLLEVCTPLLLLNDSMTTGQASLLILTTACLTNTARNVGFLAASASRAALHQALCRDHNLADVTAKTGSQTVVASVVGTTLGVGVSMALGEHANTSHLLAAFGAMVGIHQVSTYYSLTAVAIPFANRSRLIPVIEAFLKDHVILSPEEVAAQHETLFPPWKTQDDPTQDWLQIGSPLEVHKPENVEQLSKNNGKRYLLSYDSGNNTVHVTFLSNATGDDQIEAVLEATCLHHGISTTFLKEDAVQLVTTMAEKGWHIDETGVECNDAVRLKLQPGS